jgi:hypothetical protein
MNWEFLGAGAEILGAVALVASLIYVGRQFRHSSTYALESIYFQSIQNFTSSAENAGLLIKGNKDYESLSEEEKFQFGALHYNLFAVSEVIYLQYKRGLTNRETAQRVMKALQIYRGLPGFDAYWNSTLKRLLQPEFVIAVDTGELL